MVSIPGETQTYRAARKALLDAEVALRAQVEAVAAARRNLPPGAVVKPYSFVGDAGAVTLQSLVTPQRPSVMVYSMMFGGSQTHPCPMCCRFLDTADAATPHIRTRAEFVVVAKAGVDALAELRRERGWRHLTLLSAPDGQFSRDFNAESAEGDQLPMMHVFTAPDGELWHHWSSEMFFEASPWHPRHVDSLWPTWNFFDLLPEGRGD